MLVTSSRLRVGPACGSAVLDIDPQGEQLLRAPAPARLLMISNDFLPSQLGPQGTGKPHCPSLSSGQNCCLTVKAIHTPWKKQEGIKKKLPVISPPRGSDCRLLGIFPFSLKKKKFNRVEFQPYVQLKISPLPPRQQPFPML